MIELDRHIEILLLENDCVIVPDLGGFVSHYVEACYDDRDNLYLPPLRTLGFNPKLTMNDSLLVQSYVEAYDISYPEALTRIEKEVNELHQYLENQGYYELYDLGVLRLNNEGNYEFEPCEAGILTPTLYGLNTLEIDKVAQLSPVGEPYKKSDEKADASVMNMKDGSPNLLPAADASDERAIHIKLSTVRKVVAAAAAIVLLVMLAIPISNGTRSFLETCNIDKSLFYRIMPKEITSNKPSTVTPKATTPKVSASRCTTVAKTTEPSTAKTAENTPKAPKLVGEDLQSPTQPQEPTVYWTIVLASQVSKKNAEHFVDVLQKRGYAEVSVIECSNGNKVVFGRFTTETDAQNRVRTLRQKGADLADAWVMKMQVP